MSSSKGSPKNKKTQPPVLKTCTDQPALLKKWVVVQLSPTGEKEKDLSILERSVRRYLGKLEVFVPATKQITKDGVRDDSSTMFYMDGYIFVEFVEGINYGKLTDTTYFLSVLTTNRKYHLLDDSVLSPMRAGVQQLKIRSFQKGDFVKVIHGSFKNLVGSVVMIDDVGEKVTVSSNTSSKPVLMEYHASYLQKIGST